jgi:predicted metal-dependent HD superfamily phosphohydrolase
MPFAGEAFEEFVAAYLRYVEHYLTRAHVECKIERKGTKQARWSDIDVVGIRGTKLLW